jgi:hypothetical protein
MQQEYYDYRLQQEYGTTGLTNDQVREAGYKLFLSWCRHHDLKPFSRQWADEQGYDPKVAGYDPNSPNLTWDDVDLHMTNLINGYKRKPLGFPK